jgi:hypothetical protein
VPRPTRTPAARSSVSRAIPDASFAFEPGQCATATSCRAKTSMSSSDRCTECAASTRPSSTPSDANNFGTEPWDARCTVSSPSDSATWISSSASRDRAAAATSTRASGDSVYAECGP